MSSRDKSLENKGQPSHLPSLCPKAGMHEDGFTLNLIIIIII